MNPVVDGRVARTLPAHAPRYSAQIDEPERGFSYSTDAPLDMRMDQSKGQTAAEILNEYSTAELENIFRTLGEEKLSARYAAAIEKARATEPIERSGRLVEILNDATPYALRNSGHPAKRVFQALRIEVNAELDILRLHQVGKGHPPALLAGEADELVRSALLGEVGLERHLHVDVVVVREPLGDDREHRARLAEVAVDEGSDG